MNTSPNSRLISQPLYKRAEVLMTSNIATGKWEPGTVLPNEFVLAEELGVSQGTVRKALTAMEARGLLTRAPGRGTMVCRTTPVLLSSGGTVPWWGSISVHIGASRSGRASGLSDM